jgi:hypothetical protein
MLLRGVLSYLFPYPVRLRPLPWMEEDFVCCFWQAGTSVLATVRVHSLPDGPLSLGETKAAGLLVTADVGNSLQVGHVLLLGTAQQEAIGHFVVQTIEADPTEEPALQQPPVGPVVREPLTASEHQLFTYVEEWVGHADRLCNHLRDTFQLDFTRVPRIDRNQRMGMRGEVDGIRFSFHGIGCYFETEGLQLDVDFDTHGDWKGFDLQRLQTFIEWNHPQAGLLYTHIKQGLASLRKKKWLYQVDRPLDHDFYYITPDSQ